MVELTISKRIRAVHGSMNWDGKQDKELRNLTDKVKRSVQHFKHDAALADEVKSMSNKKNQAVGINHRYTQKEIIT